MRIRRLLALLALSVCLGAAADLRIYAIDVEGGKSTLFVSPTDQSMLVDTGYDGFKSDQIPIAGFQVVVVAADGQALEKPLPGAGQPNPQCASNRSIAPDTGENAHSIGMWMAYGDFHLVDLGDLYWNQEHDLAFPLNKLGKVDVYLTTHHGKKTSGSPQMVWALAPKVAAMNNGPSTGGSSQAWQTIHDSPGFVDLWQLHYATGNDAAHNVDERFIANTKEDGEGK